MPSIGVAWQQHGSGRGRRPAVEVKLDYGIKPWHRSAQRLIKA
jgi:hypothetical protein